MAQHPPYKIFNEKAVPADHMSKAELETAKNEIFSVYLSAVKSRAHPEILYVTGQAGSGKSTYIEKIIRENKNMQDAVRIDFDQLRRFHPRYQAHVKSDPMNAAARTDDSVLLLHQYLMREAMRLRANIVLDDVVMGEDITGDMLDDIAQNGYQVDTVFSVLPDALCRHLVKLRFERELKQGRPRWVKSSEQDQGPQNAVGSLKAMFNSKAVRSISYIGFDKKAFFVITAPYSKHDRIKAHRRLKREITRPLSKAEHKFIQQQKQALKLPSYR